MENNLVIYIKDAVEMTVFFLERKDLNGIYNVKTGISRSWNDLANAVFLALGMKSRIEYIEMPEELRDEAKRILQC